MKSFIDELRWRGMLHNTTQGTEELLHTKKPIHGYIGFDPTADSLHIGNLATIMLLVHFQRSGHKPFVLVGGATAMIGDPSGKKSERRLLSEEEIRFNAVRIKEQLSRFLDFDDSQNSAEMVNNYDWIGNISLIDFLRDTGKHISVNYMLAKDSVKTRMESGLSFTEFSYQLLQAYDFYFLHKTQGVQLQMGGSDQWGNITTGTELIRRTGGNGAYALTTPLVTKSDGTKFGKTESGNIWLDPKRTSPYKFHQFWVNVADDDIERFTKVFSLKTRTEIEELIQKQTETPHLRPMQYALADELTERIHGSEALAMAKKAANILFGKMSADELAGIDENTLLQVVDTIPHIAIPKTEITEHTTPIDLTASFCKNAIFSSKGEARRLIKQGGLTINAQRITDADTPLPFGPLHNRYFLVKKGKKQYFLIQLI